MIFNKKLQYLKLSKNIKTGLSHNALNKWNDTEFELTRDKIDFVMNYLESNFLAKHYLNFSKPKKKDDNFLKEKINKYKKIVGEFQVDEEDIHLIKSDVSFDVYKE